MHPFIQPVAALIALPLALGCADFESKNQNQMNGAPLAACVGEQLLADELGGRRDSSAVAINDAGQVAGYHDGIAFFRDTDGATTYLESGMRIIDLNEQGDLLMIRENPSGPFATVLWHAGELAELGQLGNSDGHMALNDHGQIVGTRTTSRGEVRAFLWSNGALQDLGVLTGYTRSVGMMINNAGQVAGYLFDDATSQTRPFFWNDGIMTELTGFPASAPTVYPSALNQHGTVVGWAVLSSDPPPPPDPTQCGPWAFQYRGFTWQGGTLTDLGLDVVPTDVNNQNQVTGYAYDPADREQNRMATPFFWQDGQRSAFESLPGYSSGAPFINEQGRVAGTLFNPETAQNRAYSWHAGNLVDLASAPGSIVSDLNDAQQIAGIARYDGGETSAAIWDVSGCP